MAAILDTSFTPLFDAWCGWGGGWPYARPVTREEVGGEPADTQEKTGRQDHGYGVGSCGFGGCLGFGAPLRASYRTYRQVRRIPSVALVRSIVLGEILGSSWTVEADDDAPAKGK